MTSCARISRVAVCLLASTLWCGAARAQATRPVGATSADEGTVPASRPAEKAGTGPRHFQAKSWATKVEPEPPSYVKTLDQHGLKGMDWLELGLEHRTRFELRDDDYRRPAFSDDEPFQLRSRGWLGVRRILDPFRIGFEFQDARQFNSDYQDTNQDVNENDVFQLYGELYFKDALGPGQPVRFRAGRMSFDVVDRRLVSRSRWRGTTTSYDGFRMQLGDVDSDWAFDYFAVMPAERRVRQADRFDEERWLHGLVGAWRKWSQAITLEPYWFILDEDFKLREAQDRELHTMGLRGFGPIGRTGLDYDFNLASQFGKDGELEQRAFATAGEIGYTFNHKWKPRLSSVNVWASGDRDPSDGLNERFDRLYGDSHGYSTSDLFVWQNVISSKLRLEAVPHQRIKVDTSYGGYWLASDNDAWVPIGRRDPQGRSGDCIGQEFEARVRYQLDPRVEIEVGYSHFVPGNFTHNTGPAQDSDFFYVSTIVQF